MIKILAVRWLGTYEEVAIDRTDDQGKAKENKQTNKQGKRLFPGHNPKLALWLPLILNQHTVLSNVYSAVVDLGG